MDTLSMMCKNVRKEPPLSATPDSNDELRADINMRSFWQIWQRTFVDVMIFYPFAQSYPNWSLAITIKTIKNQKKRKYNKRILDGENGSFTTLLLTTNGGMSNKTKNFYKRQIQLSHEKSDVSYSDTSAWVKRQISFSLLWTSIICRRSYNIPTEERMDIWRKPCGRY